MNLLELFEHFDSITNRARSMDAELERLMEDTEAKAETVRRLLAGAGIHAAVEVVSSDELCILLD